MVDDDDLATLGCFYTSFWKPLGPDACDVLSVFVFGVAEVEGGLHHFNLVERSSDSSNLFGGEILLAFDDPVDVRPGILLFVNASIAHVVGLSENRVVFDDCEN